MGAYGRGRRGGEREVTGGVLGHGGDGGDGDDGDESESEAEAASKTLKNANGIADKTFNNANGIANRTFNNANGIADRTAYRTGDNANNINKVASESGSDQQGMLLVCFVVIVWGALTCIL